MDNKVIVFTWHSLVSFWWDLHPLPPNIPRFAQSPVLFRMSSLYLWYIGHRSSKDKLVLPHWLLHMMALYQSEVIVGRVTQIWHLHLKERFFRNQSNPYIFAFLFRFWLFSVWLDSTDLVLFWCKKKDRDASVGFSSTFFCFRSTSTP